MSAAAIVLSRGAARARVLPDAGGRVTALALAGPDGQALEVLHPYPEDHRDPVRWAKGGIYPLAPFSNRIARARVRVDGVDHPVRPHPDAAPHALHGHSHLQPWQLMARSDDEATLALDAHAGDAWPWAFRAELHYRLEPQALHARITLTNRDRTRMPAGIGLHPYFRHAPSAPVGARWTTLWDQDADGLAVAARPARSDENHQLPRALPAGGLTWYASGWDGHASAQLTAGCWLHIAAEPVFGHLVVHRPDNGAYLCLEPVSHVTDGFNLAARGVSGTGTVWLAPGESLAGAMRFTLSAEPAC